MSIYDGYLKIRTKLDNKGIDKDVAELENKIKKIQEDNLSSEIEKNSLQQEIDNYEKLCYEADEYKQKIKEISQEQKKLKGQLTGQIQGYEAGTTEVNYSNVQTNLAQLRQKYKELSTEIDKQAPKIDKVYTKLDKINTKQTENNVKMTEFKQKIEQINVNKIQNGINDVGKNLQKQIGKIGKIALAVVGIRTAWYAVRSAVSLAEQYNPQIAADFEYIKFCIANMVIPAVQSLINLLYTVLSYVNAIASAWFGINMFENASVKDFQKMQKSSEGTATAMKEIEKSLQGFDEMNVIQDNSGSTTGSATSGGLAPSIDLSGIQGEVPAWMQWIIDNKDLMLATLAGITAGIIALKLGLGGIMSLGISIAVAGVVMLIQGIINFIKDPSWNNFLTILQGISLVIAGIAIVMGNWILAVAALGVAIVTYIIKNWDKVKEILRTGWKLDIYKSYRTGWSILF